VPLIEAVELAMAGEVVNASAVAGLLAAERVVSGRSRPRAVDAGWRDRPTRLAGRSG
jgi:ADP-ribose pyrophosphatase